MSFDSIVYSLAKYTQITWMVILTSAQSLSLLYGFFFVCCMLDRGLFQSTYCSVMDTPLVQSSLITFYWKDMAVM